MNKIFLWLVSRQILFLILIVHCTSANALVCPTPDNVCGCCESKHWALPITIGHTIAYEAFDDCGRKVPLINSFIDQSLTFKDISPFIKLCDDNHVRIDNVAARAPERGGAAIGPNAPFGGFRDDLYPTLLAPITFGLAGAQEYETTIHASLLYRFLFSDLNFSCGEHVALSLGIDVPFKNKHHQLSLALYDGSLFRQIFAENQTIRENSLTQFFDDYSDVFDYLVRTILGSKGIRYIPEQRKVGVGDLSFFASIELVALTHWLANWQFGLNFIIPTGGRFSHDVVWDTALGNGGAYQFDFFSNWYFNTDWFDVCSLSLFNPAGRMAFEVSAPFCSPYRIPQSINTGMAQGQPRTMVKNVPGLDAPARFDDFWVDATSVADSAVPWFAGSAVNTNIKYGWQVLVGLTNYIYNPFDEGFRLGMFYDYAFKAKDRFNPTGSSFSPGSKFDTDAVEKYTERRMHRLGWNLTYKFPNYMELEIGSMHILGGRNIPRAHDVFATLALVF